MTLAYALQQVNQSESARSQLIAQVYNNPSLKNGVMHFVLKNGGNDDDANIVFSDMIVQFFKTAFGPKAQSEVAGELEPYLYGIARYLWYNEIRRRGKQHDHMTAHPEESLEPSPESLYITSERRNALAGVLEKLRSNCRAVLMHWANGFSMQEIAEKLNYLSEGMARKKKSQCMAELNDYLMLNPHLKLQLQ